MNFIEKLFPEPNPGSALGLREVSPNDFVVPLLKRRDPKELLSQLDFFDVNAKYAYRILAEDYFAIIESRIRSDLEEEFDSLRKDSEARLGEKYSSLRRAYEPDLVEFIKGTLIASAIDGLAKNGQSGDIKYARKYLGNTKYGMADRGSIILLSKFGDSSDVDNLIKVTSELYGETKRFALDTAYKLSENRDVLLETLMNDKNDETAAIAVKILSMTESPRRIEMAKALFNSTKDKRRLEGLAIVSKYSNDNELETLLNEYVSQPSYYYNIVTWLDRCLYSNGRYLNYYKSKLFSMIEG